MNKITKFEFDHQFIREANGLYSVYDIIEVLGGVKSPREHWSRLIRYFPWILDRTSKLTFHGQGQKPTPVCDYETGIYLLSFFPRFHKGYKMAGLTRSQESIEFILECFQDFNPITEYSVGNYRVDIYFPEYMLIIECDENGHKHYDQQKEKERESYLIERLDCNIIRYNPDSKNYSLPKLISVISNWLHFYDPDCGMTAAQYRSLSDVQRSAISLAEKAAIAKMEKVNAKGNHKTANCSKLAGQYIKEAMDKLLS